MPIIYTFPSKGTPVLADQVLISDSQDGEATKNATISSIKDTIDVVDRITAGSGISVSNATGNITIGNTGVLSLTAGTNISLSGSTGAITVWSLSVGGSGTANKITKWSANGSDIENSIITEDPGGPGIIVAGNVSVASGSYISTPSILDGSGELGSANQVLSAGSSGSSIEWTSTFKGDLNGTINTATTGVTQANAVDNTTIATTAYVNNKIGLIPAGLEYSGTWNAFNNTPALASGVGTTGAFYIVSTPGSTNLDGITDWKVGDWAIFVESGATDAWQKVDNSSVLNGSGTGQKVSLWSGSGTSVTLTDSIMTQNPSGGLFAGQYIDISGSGGISASQFNIGGKLLDGNNFQGIDGYVLSSTTVGSNRKTAWVPPLTAATTTNLGGVKTVGQFGGSYIGNPITTTSGRNYGIAITSADSKLLVNVPWTDTTYTAGSNISISGTNVISASVTNLPVATQSALGGIKSHLNYGSQVTVNSITSTGSRFYGVVINDDDKAMVNVPWTDTGTTYTAGTGLTLTGTVFNANTVGTQSQVAVSASSTSLRSYPIQTGAASGASGSNHLVVNVPWTDTNTTYQAGTNIDIDGSNVISATIPLASSAVIGGFKLLTNTTGTAPSFVTTTANRNYAIQRDSNGKAMVNVPWTGTNFTAGTGLTLDGTVFNANVGETTQTQAANSATDTQLRTYEIQVNSSDDLVVNVPWVDTNTTPQATATTIGGMKIFSDAVTVAANPRTNTASRSYGIQINAGGAGQVNVPWTDTTPTASASIIGGIRLATNTVATSQNGISTTANRNYGLQIDSNSRGVINVPWTDTTYTTATSSTLGLVQIGYSENGKNYPVELLNDQMFVNVPWTDTTYTAATSSTLGLVKIGFTQAAKNYPVQLFNEQAYVNVPWADTNTTYTAGTGLTLSGTVFNVDVATSGVLGGIKSHLNYVSQVTVNSITTTSSRNYGITLNADDKAMVNVPWTDTVTPTVTASQGLTKTSNNITLDIADPTTGWAILGGGPGASTSVIGGYAGTNATGNKNFGITNFTQPSTVTSANNNVAIGFDSMGTSVTTASNNVVIGSTAGSSMTTALDAVLIGQDAGKGITTGGENTIIGANAGETITTGSRNTIIGSGAIAGTGAGSAFATVVGRDASATSSSVAVGSGAIVAGATGVAVGDVASTASNALNGIALGKGAQATLRGTVGNVAIGSSANPVSLTEPAEFSEEFEYLNVTINGSQYYIRLYKAAE